MEDTDLRKKLRATLKAKRENRQGASSAVSQQVQTQSMREEKMMELCGENAELMNMMNNLMKVPKSKLKEVLKQAPVATNSNDGDEEAPPTSKTSEVRNIKNYNSEEDEDIPPS